MARSFFTIGILLLILLPGCGKSHSPQPGLVGQWWLLGTYHTVGPSTTDYSPGSHVLQLRADSSYTKKVGQSISESGRYSVIVYNASNIRDTVISFTAGSNSYRNSVRINGLQMILGGVDVFDFYQKQ